MKTIRFVVMMGAALVLGSAASVVAQPAGDPKAAIDALEPLMRTQAAGAAAWIDMISSENDELKASYAKGFAWLDATMKGRGAADFVSASAAQQIELVDLIAYRRNASPELTPGIEFFTLVRRMTVDAFYTSAIGIKDIDYRGNTPIGSYPAPTESIAYALKRSPLG